MRHYVEITLIPNADIDQNFLWSKLYQQLHLGLVEMQDEHQRVPIGISFPDYMMGEKFGVLGGKCRLFAEDEATLAKFNAAKWLERLSDYVHCTGIRPVPGQVKGYAVYRRSQPNGSKECLARRYAKRHEVSYDDALQRYQRITNPLMAMPYIRMQSLSSGHGFCVWIKKTDATGLIGGTFSSYGLSAVCSVPEF